jgi:hypothetical protein
VPRRTAKRSAPKPFFGAPQESGFADLTALLHLLPSHPLVVEAVKLFGAEVHEIKLPELD